MSGRRAGTRSSARLLCALVVLLSVLLAAGPAQAASSEQNAVGELMKSYNSSTGYIGNVFWQSGVALSAVMTYQQATGDQTYNYAYSDAYAKHGSGNFENSYIDDTGWWALAMMQAYDITHDAKYLTVAKNDAAYMYKYWDTTCGGGLWWNTSKNYKNAIPNELFLELTAGLHNRISGDTLYLGYANAEWNWFNGSGMINANNQVNDGLSSACKNNNGIVWTYNQGVILAGLGELAKATGNTSLNTRATAIADATVSRMTASGVLKESCEPSSCNTDQQSFKGIFVRSLKIFTRLSGSTKYAGFFTAQRNAVISKDTNSTNQIGLQWNGPITALTAQSQASGIDALVAGR